MSKQTHFISQTTAFLLVFGLTANLLLDFAVAQDLSSVEARTVWLIEQYQGESINPNAKFGTAAALARLELDPNDTEVIDRITHFYDRVPAGSNAQQFSYPGVAWLLGKHWDKFTPAQRNDLKAKLKGFGDLLGHGAENHAIMKCVAAYLFAQYGPDDTGWVGGTKTSAEVAETTREGLLAVIGSLYGESYEENLSHNCTFRVIYTSPDTVNFIGCYHPYWQSDDRRWQGLNSPFTQCAQHKGRAIDLFTVSTADPWAGRTEATGSLTAMNTSTI